MDSCSNSTSSTSSSSSSSSSSKVCCPQLHVTPTVSHKKRAGRKKFKETRHPIYRGVRQRNGSKWVCEVREPYKQTRIWLGTHPTPEMAARAYDVAALALRGDSAPLNFPDSVWSLPRPKSSSTKDIQTAALEAAQKFPPAATSSARSSPPSSPSSSSSSCSSSHVMLPRIKSIEKVPDTSRMFWDEEATFNMPYLLDSMAEGLLLTPPSMQISVDWDDDTYPSVDMSLWNDY